MAESLDDKLAKIEGGERTLLQMCAHSMPAGGNMYHSDLFLLGVAKRTVALADGFRAQIAARNFICAATLLRAHLDTALRLSGATLVADPEAYADAVFSGEQVDRRKDRDGNRLTDSYLAKKLSENQPWVQNVYKELCKFGHFTSRHIFASTAKLNDENRTVHFQVSAKDPPRPDSDYFEVVDAFHDTMRIIFTFAAAWQTAKRPERMAPTTPSNDFSGEPAAA